jgi:hypothetical protein
MMQKPGIGPAPEEVRVWELSQREREGDIESASKAMLRLLQEGGWQWCCLAMVTQTCPSKWKYQRQSAKASEVARRGRIRSMGSWLEAVWEATTLSSCSLGSKAARRQALETGRRLRH